MLRLFLTDRIDKSRCVKGLALFVRVMILIELVRKQGFSKSTIHWTGRMGDGHCDLCMSFIDNQLMSITRRHTRITRLLSRPPVQGLKVALSVGGSLSNTSRVFEGLSLSEFTTGEAQRATICSTKAHEPSLELLN